MYNAYIYALRIYWQEERGTQEAQEAQERVRLS
jgi:hypothetical protein